MREMGVPSFYRWLVNKYPDIVVNAVVEKIRGGGDRDAATMVGLRNPKYDNLYLDMNGIIHPCFHPDDHLVVRTLPLYYFPSLQLLPLFLVFL